VSSIQPSQHESNSPTQLEKPKKPKRIRKTANQIKAEEAAKTETVAEELPSNGGDTDTSSLLMPPPKVAQAPSVIAAAAKAYSTPSNSNQSTPQKSSPKM
jgi:hypothetical protein